MLGDSSGVSSTESTEGSFENLKLASGRKKEVYDKNIQ